MSGPRTPISHWFKINFPTLLRIKKRDFNPPNQAPWVPTTTTTNQSLHLLTFAHWHTIPDLNPICYSSPSYLPITSTLNVHTHLVALTWIPHRHCRLGSAARAWPGTGRSLRRRLRRLGACAWVCVAAAGCKTILCRAPTSSPPPPPPPPPLHDDGGGKPTALAVLTGLPAGPSLASESRNRRYCGELAAGSKPLLVQLFFRGDVVDDDGWWWWWWWRRCDAADLRSIACLYFVREWLGCGIVKCRFYRYKSSIFVFWCEFCLKNVYCWLSGDWIVS